MSLHNHGHLWERIHNWLPVELKETQATPYLSGNPEARKAVIRFFKDGDSVPSLVLKGSRGEGRNALESESQVLDFLQSRRSQNRELGFSSPTSLRSFEQGGWSYTMETAAPGHPLSELIFLRSRRRRMEILRCELSRCAHIAASIPQALEGVVAANSVNASWYALPDGLRFSARIRVRLQAAAEKCKREQLCGHGDFTIENVFWDSITGGVSVIDWELPMRGVPRLYDMYTLLFSSLPAMALEIHESSTSELDRHFQAAFFGFGPWANATREILDDVNKPAGDLWMEMLMSLVIRTNYFLWRQPSLGKEYARLLEFAGEHEETFVGRTLAA